MSTTRMVGVAPRAVAALVTGALVLVGLSAPTQADDDPSAAERQAWSEQERRAWGAQLWQDREVEDAAVAVEAPAVDTPDPTGPGTTGWALAQGGADAATTWPTPAAVEVSPTAAGTSAEVGGLPVTVATTGPGTTPGARRSGSGAAGSVDVEVVAAGEGVAGGADGILLALTPHVDAVEPTPPTTRSQPEAETGAESGVEDESESGPQSGAEAEAESGVEDEAGSGPQSGTEPGPESDTGSLSGSEPSKGGVVATTSAVEVALDLSDVAAGVTSDWASRLRLVRLPACAMTTPQVAACQKGTPVTGQDLDLDTMTLSATVQLDALATTARSSVASVSAAGGAAATVLAVSAGASGAGGNWSATPLSSSASWQVSAGTGSFDWTYAMQAPAVPGDLAPDISLAYDSGSLDGRTVSTNNQTSVVGDGWELSTGGYVERKYIACADDMKATSAGSANNASHSTGDLCWKSDNATLVLGGKATELVKDSSNGSWRLKEDDNTLVQHLTGAWNADNDKEYWKVTTSDGTQYWFGRDKRSAADALALNSSWTVPVHGNHPGEPCYQATFAASRCQQTWRWNLDYVVDTTGNSMTYVYAREANNYGHDLGAGVSAYQRGGYLTRIDYGTRAGSEASNSPARIELSYEERCVKAAADCEPGDLTQASQSRWPDVPFDLICTSSTSCPNQYSPTFFTRKRLTSLTTKILKADGTYRGVDQWKLTHTFPDPGDGDLSEAVLWLASVQHVGLGASASISLPATTFSGTQAANRVDTQLDGRPAMTRYRLTGITAETGGTTAITYSSPDCSASSLPAAPESNSRRCLPVWWTPAGSVDPVMEYFHKYVATQVTTSPQDTTSEQVVTSYSYSGSAAWRYTDDELTPAKYRTWSTWRGYPTVDVYTGAPGDSAAPQQHTRYRYFRGMDGDRASGSGGTRSVQVDQITDHDAFAGMVREEIVYNASSEVQGTLSTPWRSSATATGAGSSSYHVGVQATRTRTTAPALPGGVRTTATTTTFDSLGIPTQVEDSGDVTTSTDDRCTRSTYVRNTSANILDTVQRSETVAKACATTPTRPQDVVADQRYAYDGAGVGTAPTKGLVTTTQQVASYSGSTPSYVTTATATYDSYGQPLTSADALGRTTRTTYTYTQGLMTKATVTSPDPDGSGAATALTTTTELDPAWGVATRTTDANGHATTGTFDALGRLTAVWEPGRVQGTDTATTTYTYTVGSSARSSTTTKTLNWDGSAYVTSTVIYDGLGRERQRQETSAHRGETGRLVSDTIYDSRGLAVTATQPWYTTGAPATGLLATPASVPGRTETTYDGAGRVTAEIFEVNNTERWRTTTTYGGDRVTVDPPDGDTPTTTLTDARGNTTELRQYTGTTPQGSYQATAYAYDPAGRLTGMTDAAGNHWAYTYDLRGRQVSASDPDAGTTTTSYDDADQVLTTTDARGKTLAYTYDALGRRTSMRAGSTAGVVRASWVFDTVAKGLLTSATRIEGGSSYTQTITGYDDHDRPSGVTVGVPSSVGALAGSYTTGYTYTLDGRIRSVKLPKVGNLAAETVTTYYDGANQAEWMSGGFPWGTYVAGSTYSPYGELLTADLGGSYSVQANWDYEAGTRRLARQWDVREGASGYDLDLAYTYDQAGNVMRVADAPTQGGSVGETQCFAYDGLRRLTSAWTPASGSCAAAPTSAGLGGPAKYWTSWSFDAAGNRVSQVAHATGGIAQDTTSTYAYPAAGSAQAHAVASVTSSGGSSGTSTFAYDAAGNTTTRAVTGQASQTLTWDVEGHLAGVSEAGVATDSYVYTADGDRLLRTQDGVTTLYLPGGQEVSASGSGVSAVRYYSFAGRTVGVRTGGGAAGTWTVVGDHHGTPLLQVAQASNTVARSYTDPYGNARGVPASLVGDRGFVDKVVDTSGLVSVGARYFDAVLGRFVSVDPVLDTTDPSQFNPYSYAGCNPLTWSDPSGLFSFKDAWRKYGGSVVGVVAGGLVTAGCLALTGGAGSIGCGAAGGFVGSMVAGAVHAKANGTRFNWRVEVKKAAVSAVVGGVLGGVGGAIGRVVSGSATRVAAAARSVFRPSYARAPSSGIRATTTRTATTTSRGTQVRPFVEKAKPGVATTRREMTTLTRYDPTAASRTLLGQVGDGYARTPGGRTVSAHAADRIVNGAGGRPPTALERVDDILDNPMAIRYDPLRDTVRVSQGRSWVIVRGTGIPQHIVTVMVPQ